MWESRASIRKIPPSRPASKTNPKKQYYPINRARNHHDPHENKSYNSDNTVEVLIIMVLIEFISVFMIVLFIVKLKKYKQKQRSFLKTLKSNYIKRMSEFFGDVNKKFSIILLNSIVIDQNNCLAVFPLGDYANSLMQHNTDIEEICDDYFYYRRKYFETMIDFSIFRRMFFYIDGKSKRIEELPEIDYFEQFLSQICREDSFSKRNQIIHFLFGNSVISETTEYFIVCEIFEEKLKIYKFFFDEDEDDDTYNLEKRLYTSGIINIQFDEKNALEIMTEILLHFCTKIDKNCISILRRNTNILQTKMQFNGYNETF